MIPKFRAWDKKKERMIEWIDLDFSKDNGEDFIIVFEPTGIVRDAIISPILLQSTGLFDKNGTEIFIGDILEWEMVMGFGWYENGKDVVIYDEKELKIKMSKRDDYSLNRVVGVGCKVVGNKFEHPHLL